MEQYELYPVRKCDSFEEYFKILEFYSSRIAFSTQYQDYTYQELCVDILKIVRTIREERRIYILKIDDPYLFTVGYLGIILSNNICYLVDPKQIDYNSIPYTILTNMDIELLLDSNQLGEIKKSNINEACTIAMSSGTTSQVKEVMLSQKNLLSDTVSGMELYQYNQDARYLHLIPYTHLFGLVADLLGPLLSGATICYGNQLDFYNNLQYFSITNLNLPPKMISDLYRFIQIHPENISSLKKILCAGARLETDMIDQFKQYNIDIYTAYGLTECSPCVTMSRDRYYREGSVGLVLSCCKVKIVDDEVLVKGDNVMLGYMHCDNDVIDVDGYLHTGDLGYLDEDGFLFLTGRKSSLIVFDDGTKLLPEEVESKINQIDRVVESLVTASGTKINIQIVIEPQVCNHTTKQNHLFTDLYPLIEQYNLIGKIKNISYLTTPLPRTSLGKLIRS